MSEHPTNAPIRAHEEPAFPEAGLSGLPNGEFIHGRAGMSLRAYFMAHAPAEPQAWFVPNIPTPPARPEWLNDRTQSEADELAAWVKHCLDPKDMHEPRAREFAFSYDAYLLAMALHRRDVNRERYLQWPAAWADAQLAILGGQP